MGTMVKQDLSTKLDMSRDNREQRHNTKTNTEMCKITVPIHKVAH